MAINFETLGTATNAADTVGWNEVTRRDQLIRTVKEPLEWWGRNGRQYVQTMTVKHIKHCLARCKRDNWRTQYIPKFEEEIRLREPLLHK